MDNTTPSTVQGMKIDRRNIESGSHCKSGNTPTLGAYEEVVVERTDDEAEIVDECDPIIVGIHSGKSEYTCVYVSYTRIIIIIQYVTRCFNILGFSAFIFRCHKS